MSDHDVAEFELGLRHGELANTPPILFWLLVHSFASVSVTAAIRSELLGLTSTPAVGKREVSIKIATIESQCAQSLSQPTGKHSARPTLTSLFAER
jgi:hypothetical protein